MAHRRSPRLSAPNSPSFQASEVVGGEEAGETGEDGGASGTPGEIVGEGGGADRAPVPRIEDGDVVSAGEGVGEVGVGRGAGDGEASAVHPRGDLSLRTPESPPHSPTTEAAASRVSPPAARGFIPSQVAAASPTRPVPTLIGSSVSSGRLAHTVAELFPRSSSPPSPASPPPSFLTNGHTPAVSSQPSGNDGEEDEHQVGEERGGDEGTWSSGDGQYHGLRSLELEAEEANKRASRKLPPEEVSVWGTTR